jgi:integrase
MLCDEPPRVLQNGLEASLSPHEDGVEKTRERAKTPEIGEARVLVYCVALLTGLRWKEIANLKWSDLDFKAAKVTIRARTAKTRREQVVDLNPELVSAFETHRKRAEELDVRDAEERKKEAAAYDGLERAVTSRTAPDALAFSAPGPEPQVVQGGHEGRQDRIRERTRRAGPWTSMLFALRSGRDSRRAASIPPSLSVSSAIPT